MIKLSLASLVEAKACNDAVSAFLDAFDEDGVYDLSHENLTHFQNRLMTRREPSSAYWFTYMWLTWLLREVHGYDATDVVYKLRASYEVGDYRSYAHILLNAYYNEN